MLQLATWISMVAMVFAECVTRLRSDGVGKIIGHRLFANGSLGVVDEYARFMIFDGGGGLFYKENLNLPNDPARTGSPYRISFAIITASTNELYLLSTNDKSFRYSAGVYAMASYGGSVMMVNYGQFFNLPDFGVVMGSSGPLLYQVNSTFELHWMGNLYPAYGTGYMMNISYVGRISANPLTQEFYLVTLSNKTFAGTVDQPNYQFVPDSSTAASYVSTEASFYVITSSIGGNTDYLAFAGYYPWSASHKHEHYLRVKERATGVSASLLITDYHIWSVALDNSTSTKMYFLTHDGSLYSATFSASSIDAPTLMVKDLFVRYASLEIISSTKLLLRTVDTMVIFDIPTSAITIRVDIKPTGGRHFGSKMFVLTHNFNVSLYEISGNLPVRDNSFNYVGKVKELIVSTVYNRFYILTSNALYTYSLSTYTQLASRTMAQMRTMTGATSIISLNDFAPLVLDPSKLVVVAFGDIGGTRDTFVLILNEINLSYKAYYWTGLLDNFMSVSGGHTLSGCEQIVLYRPNIANLFYYYPANNSFFDPINFYYTRFVPLSNRPEIENMKDVLYLSIPAGDKQLPRTDLQAGSFMEANVESNRINMLSITSTSVFKSTVWAEFYVPLGMMVQRLQGNLNKTLVSSCQTFMIIQYPNMSSYHHLRSNDFAGGIGYQKPDNTFRFFNGDLEIHMVDPLECYADPTKGYQIFDYPCWVPDCKLCSALNPYICLACNAGLVLKEDLKACLTTCNPAYALNGKCYADCPIEYYKYNAAFNTCDTPLECTGGSPQKNMLALGDMCNSVPSCPAGSTSTSNYCTFPSTSAANPTSTAVVTLPCSAGQLYFPHFSMCVSSSNPFYANYTVSGSTLYCDGSTHFYDIATNRCLKTCDFYSGLHPQMGFICTTAANCVSMGMFTDDTTSGVKHCTSTCGSTLWTNQITMSCETACTTTSTYSLAANRNCLSEASCLAAVGFGLLSMINSRCVSSCGPSQYLITASRKCVSDTDCWGLSYLTALNTRLCQPTCFANEYMDNVAQYCYTKKECSSLSLLTKAASPTNLCISACVTTDYLDQDQKSCVTRSECTVDLRKFVIASNKTCVSSCPTSLQFVVNRECVSSCPAGYYFEESLPDCVSKCAENVSILNPAYCLRYLSFRIVSAEQTDRDSVVVILEVYFESNSTSTVTSFSVELATLFKQVGIVTDTSSNAATFSANLKRLSLKDNRIEVELNTTFELGQSSRVFVSPEYNVEFKANRFRSMFRKSSLFYSITLLPSLEAVITTVPVQMSKAASLTLLATRYLAPFMMSTFVDLPSGSFLCLIAQTYTKLLMMTSLNFKLETNAYSMMYYGVFKEFLNTFNEEMMETIVGKTTVEKNKQYVCEEGFDKLCFLTVEDNFFMSHLLMLLIFGCQALIIYIAALVCQMLKYKESSEFLFSKLKNVMLYAFILESSIEIWFTLLLNALIFVFRILVLTVMKIGGHIMLVVMLVFFVKLLTQKSSSLNEIGTASTPQKSGVDLTNRRVQNVFQITFIRLRSIIKELTTEERASVMLKCLLVHDLMFAILLVSGKYLGYYQMLVWLVAEMFIFGFLSVFRPFGTRLMNIRQIGIEFLMMILLGIMSLVPHFKDGNRMFSILILIISLIILVIDFTLAAFEWVRILIKLLKYLFSNKNIQGQVDDHLPTNRANTTERKHFIGMNKLTRSDNGSQNPNDSPKPIKQKSAKVISSRIVNQPDSRLRIVQNKSNKLITLGVKRNTGSPPLASNIQPTSPINSRSPLSDTSLLAQSPLNTIRVRPVKQIGTSTASGLRHLINPSYVDENLKTLRLYT